MKHCKVEVRCLAIENVVGRVLSPDIEGLSHSVPERRHSDPHDGADRRPGSAVAHSDPRLCDTYVVAIRAVWRGRQPTADQQRQPLRMRVFPTNKVPQRDAQGRRLVAVAQISTAGSMSAEMAHVFASTRRVVEAVEHDTAKDTSEPIIGLFADSAAECALRSYRRGGPDGPTWRVASPRPLPRCFDVCAVGPDHGLGCVPTDAVGQLGPAGDTAVGADPAT